MRLKRASTEVLVHARPSDFMPSITLTLKENSQSIGRLVEPEVSL